MLDAISTLPLWQALVFYASAALLAAILVLRLTRRWMRALAARTHTVVSDVLAESLPRPLALSTFLVLVALGAKWLPIPEDAAQATRRFIPFAAWITVVFAALRVTLRAIDAYGTSNPELKSSAGIGRAAAWVAGGASVAAIVSDALGVSLAPALTALGVGSLAMALALQDTLSNFFAGLYLVADKPVRPGDFVRLDGGQEGYVETIGWRSTHLKTLAASWIVVPNATLSKAVLTNFKSGNPRLVVETRVDVAHDADVDAAAAALGEEAQRAADIAGVDKNTAPFVRFAPGFTDVSLAFTVSVRIIASADAGAVQSELRRRIFARLRERGIALALNPILVRSRGS